MSESIVCQNIRVSGVVQGVGFRPFVWRLARELGLAGWVRNDSRGVEIEVRGAAAQVQVSSNVWSRTRRRWPGSTRWSPAIRHRARIGEGFVIIDSRSGRAATMIGHDTAVCRDCLTEMFDPGSRRWRYAFTNCTNCGPRYTISRGLPYDRVRTSLKPFAMCPVVSVSTGGPRTGVFTPRPIAARSAVRSCSCSTARDTACPTTRSATALALLRRGRSSPSRAWAVFIWPATPATRSPSPCCASASSVTRSPLW
jgi:hydrogenase maturation factor HypF (carbamoyltransferase family)